MMQFARVFAHLNVEQLTVAVAIAAVAVVADAAARIGIAQDADAARHNCHLYRRENSYTPDSPREIGGLRR